MTPAIKAFALYGGLASASAVGATAVVYDFDFRNLFSPQTVEQQPAPLVASVPEQDAEPTQVEEPVVAALPESVEAPQTVEPVVEADKDIIVPTFDIVRVEPDGSTLIAGRAAPESDVEIARGAEIVARATTNTGGEFVAILDEALPPGDHTLVIRATEPSGRVVTSTQTAIIAVPDDQADGVLALVETPGEPSRLISTPEPAPAPVETAMVEPEIVESSSPPGLLSLGEGTPLLPDVEEEVVEVAAAPTQETPTVAVDDGPDVAIEAVEIDGAEIFVAGSATPGSRLRIYANDMLLGDTVADEGGRFLVQVARDLPVGDYIIRADVLNPLSAEVIRRAAVPFTRGEGERLAAVATPSTDETASAEAPISAEGLAPLQGAPTITTEVAALVPTDQSVIIRRGDTLWQISRRIYGQGVKYSTIYLANQDQIENPERIWPGQIFAVPEEAADDATALERHQELQSQR